MWPVENEEFWVNINPLICTFLLYLELVFLVTDRITRLGPIDTLAEGAICGSLT
jgi:hypothetical protein